MKKADKIKICREFKAGKSVEHLTEPYYGGRWRRDQVDFALRWGLKHPEGLKKGKNDTN